MFCHIFAIDARSFTSTVDKRISLLFDVGVQGLDCKFDSKFSSFSSLDEDMWFLEVVQGLNGLIVSKMVDRLNSNVVDLAKSSWV